MTHFIWCLGVMTGFVLLPVCYICKKLKEIKDRLVSKL